MMIPNITRGTNMRGLISYLAGPGRRNEHLDQHVVAGSEDVEFRFDGVGLDRDRIRSLGRLLDSDSANSNVVVSDGHVWHCSLSVGKMDGILNDARWRGIAHRFVTRMGFDDADGVKAPCRWVAVRHGLSGETGEGNDHIHIVVNLVRSDGTKAWVYRDYRRAQDACRALEWEFDLECLGCDRTLAATRGWKPGEREAEARRRAQARFNHDYPEASWSALSPEERGRLIDRDMAASQPRRRLELKVRAAASQADNEAQFVRNLRKQNVIVRPRYVRGRTDMVAGYSVADRPVHGESPIWYGGGSLARDLTLPRLRQYWTSDPKMMKEAVVEWNASVHRTVSSQTSEATSLPGVVANRMRTLNRRLHELPVEDRESWASVAREAAGMMPSWSHMLDEPSQGPLAQAALDLSRSAQTYARPRRFVPEARDYMMDAARLVVASARDDEGRLVQAILMRQMWRTVMMIRQSMVARDDVYLARITRETQERELAAMAKTLPEIPEHVERKLQMQVQQTRQSTAAAVHATSTGDPSERFGMPRSMTVRRQSASTGNEIGR